MAWVKAVASGNASATATWQGGVVPVSGDVADLNGFQVVFDVALAGVTVIDGNSMRGAFPVSVATAVANGLWTATSTWSPAVVPNASTFVYTNGKQVTLDGTGHCAGLADTAYTGGLVLDAGGNAALLAAMGDSLFASVQTMRTLNGSGAASYGMGPLTVNNGSYVTDSVGGNTQVWQSAGLTSYPGAMSFTFNPVGGTDGCTLEFMWKPNTAMSNRPMIVLHTQYTGYVGSIDPLYNKIEFSPGYGGNPWTTAGVRTVPGFDTLDVNAWHHIAVQKVGTSLSFYVDGVLRMSYTQSSPQAVSAAVGWCIEATSGGRIAHVRLTNAARYSGNPHAGYSLPFPTFAPAPGSTLSGRVLLGTNGALVQHALNPANVTSGVLQSLNNAVLSYLSNIDGKTSQLTFTGSNVNAAATVDLTSVTTPLASVKAKTDQLTFTGGGVVADNSGVATDYTARFNTLDTSVGAANTAVAAVKAKTDQLTFSVAGVVADAGGTDYTVRFNNIDAALADIPVTDYTTRFNAIDTDLAAIATGGGVDFTPVLTAVGAVDTKVTAGNTTTTAIKAKTDQMTFTANGVVADVSVSVAQVINYDSRFDALDLSAAGIKAKTDQLTFGVSGVNATATIDTAPVVTAVSAAIADVGTAVDALTTDLGTHDAEIKAQLTTIQNATGAIDLTPIITSLATVDTHVLAIPTVNYTSSLNSVHAKLDNLSVDLGNVDVDLTPVTTAVAGVQTTTNLIKAKTDTIAPTDLTPVTTAVAGVQTTANLIKAKTDTIAPCDTSAVVAAVNALEARFDAEPDVPVVVVPAPTPQTTVFTGTVVDSTGAPQAGVALVVWVAQASNNGVLASGAPQTVTSGVGGAVSVTLPRGSGNVFALKYGSRTERFPGVDAATGLLPSIVSR